MALTNAGGLSFFTFFPLTIVVVGSGEGGVGLAAGCFFRIPGANGPSESDPLISVTFSLSAGDDVSVAPGLFLSEDFGDPSRGFDDGDCRSQAMKHKKETSIKTGISRVRAAIFIVLTIASGIVPDTFHILCPAYDPRAVGIPSFYGKEAGVSTVQLNCENSLPWPSR